MAQSCGKWLNSSQCQSWQKSCQESSEGWLSAAVAASKAKSMGAGPRVPPECRPSSLLQPVTGEQMLKHSVTVVPLRSLGGGLRRPDAPKVAPLRGGLRSPDASGAPLRLPAAGLSAAASQGMAGGDPWATPSRGAGPSPA